ncbi:sortase (surface protein transpeptidase) [Weissella uvarum]|uniref:class A sortase n=1 Tax=Weissella uvarum TaxID=1479233 RepID=UPI001961CA51|nr:class A sortase [Weissella uvarum]MBM7617851.1 sortase (surface protein transpeptidase) [Weissella uvarum]MCM0596151.1 class A sortase [Weissella uvarum]
MTENNNVFKSKFKASIKLIPVLVLSASSAFLVYQMNDGMPLSALKASDIQFQKNVQTKRVLSDQDARNKGIKPVYRSEKLRTYRSFDEIQQAVNQVDPANVGSVGTIYYPAAGVQQPLYQGVSEDTLALGAGTGKPNMKPGKGNYVAEAHNAMTSSNVNDHNLWFSNLQGFAFQKNQPVYLIIGDEAYVYKSVARRVVDEHDVYLVGDLKKKDKDGNYVYDYLGSEVKNKENIYKVTGGKPLLTLQTCYIPVDHINSDDTTNITQRVILQAAYAGKTTVDSLGLPREEVNQIRTQNKIDQPDTAYDVVNQPKQAKEVKPDITDIAKRFWTQTAGKWAVATFVLVFMVLELIMHLPRKNK